MRSQAVDNCPDSGSRPPAVRHRLGVTRPSWMEELHGAFLGSRAVDAGVLTRNQLRGNRYTRLFRDVYVPVGYPRTHAVRCEAAALVVPETAVLTGRSAAATLGVDLTRPADPVEWLVQEGLQFRFPGMVVKRMPISTADWRQGEFCRIASPARMAFDLARQPNIRKAVSQRRGARWRPGGPRRRAPLLLGPQRTRRAQCPCGRGPRRRSRGIAAGIGAARGSCLGWVPGHAASADRRPWQACGTSRSCRRRIQGGD